METRHFDAVLAARAEKMARRSPKRLQTEDKTLITVVNVGAERFGVPTRHLTCIIKSPAISGMPGLPAWLKGVCQIRGELVAVVDIAVWFGLAKKSRGDYMAVVESKKRKLGLLIDVVGGFREVGASEIAETFGGASMGNHPIFATTKDITTILDVPKLFDNRDMVIGAAGASGRAESTKR